MSHLLPRFHRSQLAREDRAAVDKAVREAVDATPQTVARATLPGDTRRLRGIPVVGFMVGGTSPGTDPMQALLHSDRSRRYDSGAQETHVERARRTPSRPELGR